MFATWCTKRKSLNQHCFYVWIANYTSTHIWDVISHPCTSLNGGLAKTSFELKSWTSNYIPHKTFDVISYPCSSLSDSYVPLAGARVNLLPATRVVPRPISTCSFISLTPCQTRIPRTVSWTEYTPNRLTHYPLDNAADAAVILKF